MILYNWYTNKEIKDSSSNQVVSIAGTKKFINEAVDYIKDKVNKL